MTSTIEPTRSVAAPRSDAAPVPERWGPAAVRARLARAVVRTVARRVPVEISMPEGSLLARPPAGHAPYPRIEVVRPEAMFARLAAHPKIGIGEGYSAGDWRVADGHDLAQVLRPFAERMTSAVPPVLSRMRRVVERPLPHQTRNTPTGSRRNIEAHYDLSNDLFAAFLDPSMMYSAALFDPTRPLAEQDLTAAQHRKVDRVLDQARVGPGSRVLEIGTGWGTLALRAAQRGAHVTTVTLSREQAALAADRVAEAGLTHLVDIRIEDYREVRGTYDAVVSIEMIEAVGEEFWPTYFATLDERLAPGGVAVVQSILMAHDRVLATRNSYGWIQKHIFPGGLIPSLEAIETVTAEHTRLQVRGVHRFGRHYAETLRRWRATFIEQWPTIAATGFDEEFRRTWEFYLAYCEVGFDSGYLDVAHLRLERPQDRA